MKLTLVTQSGRGLRDTVTVAAISEAYKSASLAGSLPVSLGGWGQFSSGTFYRVFLWPLIFSFFSNSDSDVTCQRGSENDQKE